MKTLTLILGLSILSLSGCNAAPQKEQSVETGEIKQPETAKKAETAATNPVSIKAIVDAYLGLKTALAKDNSQLAAKAGKDLEKAFETFDKTALSPEQSKLYADIEEDAKEHAEHIGENAGNIKHQREHFEILSKDVYELVKTFGAGQKLYYDYCPMYNKNKGGYWISETKAIQNPYLGKSMPTCGMVKEELK